MITSFIYFTVNSWNGDEIMNKGIQLGNGFKTHTYLQFGWIKLNITCFFPSKLFSAHLFISTLCMVWSLSAFVNKSGFSSSFFLYLPKFYNKLFIWGRRTRRYTTNKPTQISVQFSIILLRILCVEPVPIKILQPNGYFPCSYVPKYSQQ